MHENEIQTFTDAVQLIQDKFYVDGINKFKQLVNEFPESDLADDALYNIGLCYFEMNQFNQCIEILKEMIEKYPNATITALENENEFGKTAGKAHYLIVLCYIGLNDIQEAESYIPILKEHSNNTYIIKDDQKITFAQLADDSIKKFKNIRK